MANCFQLNNFQFQYPFSQVHLQFKGAIQIKTGDAVLLQGESGSGKSTLLQALKGIIPHQIYGHYQGEIWFKRQLINTIPPEELIAIGYVQQNPATQLICSTVAAELAFSLENKGLSSSAITARITQIAAQFNISHLLARNVTSLSGGEQQKVCLAAWLALEPEVLLLDEPTAFLDPETAAEIIQILRAYQAQHTLIIIEHNLHYLSRLINRYLHLDAIGNLRELPLSSLEAQPTLPLQPIKSHCPPSPLAPLLVLKQFNYTYPNAATPLLEDLSFTIYPGTITAIIGKNGAGKSTLLKLISGILPAPRGIYWQQQSLTNIPKLQLWQQLTLLWQNPELHFLETTVATEVNGNLELLAEFGLSEQAQQNPFTLSVGQKRRLSLAIALQQPRQLLLLDEPTFGQDFKQRLRLAQIFNRLANNGSAILIVSHDLEFVASLTNHVYCLENGQLQSCI